MEYEELDPAVLTATWVPEGLVVSSFLLFCSVPAASCPRTGLFPEGTVCGLHDAAWNVFSHDLSAHDETPSAGQMKTGISQNVGPGFNWS